MSNGSGSGATLASQSSDVDESDRLALEAFLLENPELDELEQLASGFNLFEAIGAVRREARHSDFLAYLLDPAAPHGLGIAVLRGLIDSILVANQGGSVQLSRIDAALMNLETAKVEREWSGIDILVHSERDQFVFLIENKID